MQRQIRQMRPKSSRRTNNKIQQGHSQFDGHLQQLATTSCNNSRKLQMQLIKEKNNNDDKLQISPATKQMRPTAHSAQRATCNLQRGTGNVQQQPQQQRESASQTGRHRQRRSRALLQHVKINQLIDLVLFMSNSISINEQRTRMQNAKAATMRASETERVRERRQNEQELAGKCVTLATGAWAVASLVRCFFCGVFCLGVALRRACVK